MTQPKTYILKKDLPDIKAGAELKKLDEDNGRYYFHEDNPFKSYSSNLVENNPQWFEEKKLPMSPLVPKKQPFSISHLKAIIESIDDNNTDIKVTFHQVRYLGEDIYTVILSKSEVIMKAYSQLIDDKIFK